MSHEGIRFISEEEAQKLAREDESPICPARPPSRLESGCRRPPVPAWRSTGKTAIKAVGTLPGCAMPVLAPPAMRSAERPAASQVSRSRSLRRCCRCTKRRRGRSPFPPSAATPSVFAGTTAIRAGSTPGITFAAIANASSRRRTRELCSVHVRVSSASGAAALDRPSRSRLSWRDVANRQSLPKLLQTFERFSGILNHMNVGVIFRA